MTSARRSCPSSPTTVRDLATMTKRPAAARRLGVDFAGTVAALGRSVTRFSVGDAVFGNQSGSLGEYLAVPADREVVRKPTNLTFEQAAAVPAAAMTALQALGNKARVERGQKVLVNGASGGVGTFAVQLAKVFGAQAGTVTPVIDRQYPFSQTTDALRQLESGRARGKVVVTFGD